VATTYRVPYWRGDVTGAADLVEDVIRVVGYEQIPVGPPRFTSATVSVPADLWEFKGRLRHLMAGAGFQEVLSYSLVNRDRLALLTPGVPPGPEPLSIANPMSRDLECLRTSLRASMLDVLARNRRREQLPVMVFELSRVYLPEGDALPDERETLCAILSGASEPVSWHHTERSIDFYDAKGIAELLLHRLGIEAVFAPGTAPGLFPGRHAGISADGEQIGVVGQLHPLVCRTFEVESNTFVLELDVALLLKHARETAEYEPLSRFPTSERDVALVLDRSVAYQRVIEIVKGFALVADASLFDVYQGEQIPAGKQSFAIHIVFQAPDRTLTDAEVTKVLAKILARLETSVGAVLRA
jgi:phenylalanyl-tRNA synthetase beta chain